MSSIPSSITNEALNDLPLISFKGEIVVIDSMAEFQKCIPELQICSILGFDTETRPSFKKGRINKMSLLQLSTNEKAYLFRIHKIGIPNELKDLLANPKIKKIGVAVHDDIKGLNKIKPFKASGFVELQEYVKLFGIENFSLRKLSALILNGRISKSQQLSNWEADELNNKQKIYAATDAWACYKIYLQLKQNELLN